MSQALPHLTLDGRDGSLAGPWRFMRGDDPVVLEDGLEGWDLNMEVNLERRIGISSELCLERLGLDPEAKLRLCVLVSTGPGRYGVSRRKVKEVSFLARSGLDSRLAIFLDSKELNERLKIETVLVLHSSPPGPNPLAAHRPASRLLLADEVVVPLEGEGDQLPIVTLPFPPEYAQASWMVRLDAGLVSDPVLPRLRVELNSRVPGLQAEMEDAANSRARSELRADVARHVVEAALEDPEAMRDWVDMQGEHPGEVPRGERSLAELALDYLNQLYPTATDPVAEALFEKIDSRPRFEARFQSLFAEVST